METDQETEKKQDKYVTNLIEEKQDKYAKDLTEQIRSTKTADEIKDLQNSVEEIKHEINDLKFCIKQFIEMLTTPSYEEDDDEDEYEGEDAEEDF
jgi:hypothetical protein